MMVTRLAFVSILLSLGLAPSANAEPRVCGKAAVQHDFARLLGADPNSFETEQWAITSRADGKAADQDLLMQDSQSCSTHQECDAALYVREPGKGCYRRVGHFWGRVATSTRATNGFQDIVVSYRPEPTAEFQTAVYRYDPKQAYYVQVQGREPQSAPGKHAARQSKSGAKR